MTIVNVSYHFFIVFFFCPSCFEKSKLWQKSSGLPRRQALSPHFSNCQRAFIYQSTEQNENAQNSSHLYCRFFIIPFFILRKNLPTETLKNVLSLSHSLSLFSYLSLSHSFAFWRAALAADNNRNLFSTIFVQKAL